MKNSILIAISLILAAWDLSAAEKHSPKEGWVNPSGTYVRIVEDKRNRSVEIITFKIDADGKEILHGISVAYDWGGRFKIETMYQDGVPTRLSTRPLD